MRIGVDIKSLLLTGMGIANHVTPLLDGALCARTQDHFVLLGPPGTLPWDDLHNVERVNIPYAARGGRFAEVRHAWQRFPKAIAAARLDALICPYFDVVLPQDMASLVGVYDLCMIRLPQVYPLLLRGYYNMLLRANMRRAKLVFTSSQYSKEDIIREFDIAGDRVHVIYGSLAPEFADTKPDSVAQKVLAETLGLQGRPFLLYTGGIERRKNIACLLGAMRILRERSVWRDLVLMATGPEQHYAKFHPQIETLGLTNYVVFAGKLSRTDLKQLYCMAEAVVYPSLFEGFGMPIIEAINAGVPVAASSATCLPEVGGDYPFYFDPSNIGEMVEACGAALAAPRSEPVPLPDKFTPAYNVQRFLNVLEQLA